MSKKIIITVFTPQSRTLTFNVDSYEIINGMVTFRDKFTESLRSYPVLMCEIKEFDR